MLVSVGQVRAQPMATRVCMPYQPPHKNTNRTAATKDTSCQAYKHLCKSTGSCEIALQTQKYKKTQGEPKVDCCSAAYCGFRRTKRRCFCFAGSRAAGRVALRAERTHWQWLPATVQRPSDREGPASHAGHA
jgi:hypothetical protein